MRAAVEDDVVGLVTVVEAVGAHASPIAARVLGPSMPVFSIPCSLCHCLTAAWVRGPNLPVGDGKSVYALWRNVWSAVTGEPVAPIVSVGHPPAGGAAAAKNGVISQPADARNRRV